MDLISWPCRTAVSSPSRVFVQVIGSTTLSLDLGTVIRLMAAHQVKRLPVVDQHKELVGIVSRADVLRAIAAPPEPSEAPEHEPPRFV